MNKLDRRFLKGISNTINGKIGGRGNSSVDNAKAGEKYIIAQALSEGSPLFGFPVNSIAYYDGERWINFMPETNEQWLYGSDILQFNGTEWVQQPSRMPYYNYVDKIVIDSGTTKPTKSAVATDSYFYVVGDEFLYMTDKKVYKVTAVDDDGNITLDEGTVLTNGTTIYSVFQTKVFKYSNDGTEEKLESLYSEAVKDFTFIYVREKEKFYSSIYIGRKQSFVGFGESLKKEGHMTVEQHTLTAEDITAKGFTLSKSVATGEETNVLCFVSGVIQPVGIAFSMTNSTFYWTDKTLDGHVSAGDVVILQYYAVN